MKLSLFIVVASLAVMSSVAVAKLPPAPAEDPKVTAEKAEKAKADAEKAKALQAAAEERSVKNFQENMKKTGRPVPKPTPLAVLVPPTGASATTKAVEKPAAKK